MSAYERTRLRPDVGIGTGTITRGDRVLRVTWSRIVATVEPFKSFAGCLVLSAVPTLQARGVAYGGSGYTATNSRPQRRLSGRAGGVMSGAQRNKVQSILEATATARWKAHKSWSGPDLSRFKAPFGHLLLSTPPTKSRVVFVKRLRSGFEVEAFTDNQSAGAQTWHVTICPHVTCRCLCPTSHTPVAVFVFQQVSYSASSTSDVQSKTP